ncbi:MAG: RNA 2',3'-cyclic phosphodiesterase [Candidatus Tyrphobacter sp.]
MRLFIGIAIDDQTRIACASVATRLDGCGVNARFVDPENYHMTLAFLGSVDSGRLCDIVAATRSVAQRHAPFLLAFDRIGAFPHERKPRVIFVGSRGADNAYRVLSAQVREVCAALGYGSENDAVAHVTLARVPGRVKTTLPLLEIDPFTVAVDALTVFDSVPRDGKTRYEKRAAFPLTRAG